MADNEQRSGGVGIGGLLQVSFIVLKLIGKITWSWWWVMAPTWIVGAFIALILAIAGIVAIMDAREKSKRRA